MKITPVQLAKRCETWQKRLAELGIAHFRFTVTLADEVPGNPNSAAAARASSDYDTVHFCFTHDFLEGADEQELDETIVHEWLHVALRDLDIAIEGVERWMPEGTHEMFVQSIDHEREGVIDRLSRALCTLHRGAKPRFSP